MVGSHFQPNIAIDSHVSKGIDAIRLMQSMGYSIPHISFPLDFIKSLYPFPPRLCHTSHLEVLISI